MNSMSARSNAPYKVLGTRPIRHDGLDKVTGQAKYGADVNIAGMLYGKILRSPHAHAVIKSIDASAALEFSGREVCSNLCGPALAIGQAVGRGGRSGAESQVP